MILKTVIQQISFKVLTFIISLYMSFAGPFASPAKDTPIAPKDAGSVKLVFAATADPQISNYILKRYPTFKACAQDFAGSQTKLDAFVIAGDVAENGLAEEYQLVYDELKGLDTRFILSEGNHDIRLRVYGQSLKRFSSLANALNGDENMNSFHYSEEINGYKFVVMGSDRTEFEESYINDEQLEWLDNEVKSAQGKPVFVILHQPLKDTHGLPDTWGSPIDSAGSVGAQSDAIKDVLCRYKNVILITGHLHTGFGEYSYEEIGSLKMVNLPSLTIDNKDGESGPGIGYIVEAYENEIIFRARSFATGKWMPEYDIAIEVE